MAGVPIGHAPVPTDQQDLSGETNDEVDDPRRGRAWLARSNGRTLRRRVRFRRRCFTRTVL